MDRRIFVRLTALLMSSVALPQDPAAQPVAEPVADAAAPGAGRIVICEAYAPGYPARQVESAANPIFKNLAFTSGLNYPTRLLPDYVRLIKDPAAYARFDIRMAQAIGIDAFCFGDTSHGFHTQFTDVYWAYWQVARQAGFKLVPFTLMLNKGGIEAARWQGFLDTWHELAAHYRDVILQIDGKYALHSWTPRPLDDTVTPDDEIDLLLQRFGGPQDVFLIQQTTYLQDMASQSPVIARLKAAIRSHASAVTQFQEDSYGDLSAAAQDLAGLSRELGKELVYPAMPAFFQSRWQFAAGPHPGGRINEKLGFAGYYQQWRRAIDEQARIVYITTWNDVTEDHAVMPEELHGYAYYELTRYFIAWFKTGSRPPVQAEQILLFHHPQLTETPLQVPPGALTAGRFGNAATPPADYLGLVVMLKAPATITVETGVSSTGIPNTQLAARDFAAGVNFWLIYHPLSSSSQSAIQDINRWNPFAEITVPVYPQAREDFFITILAQGFEDREVFVSVDRGPRNIGYFTSKHPIVGAAAAGNLGTVGNVFALEG